jgi:hypothetical protein
MRLAAGGGCFVYGEGALLSIVQGNVLTPNLLHLQWQMEGGGWENLAATRNRIPSLLSSVGQEIYFCAFVLFKYIYIIYKYICLKVLTRYVFLKCYGWNTNIQPFEAWRLVYVPPGSTFRMSAWSWLYFTCFLWILQQTATFAIFCTNSFSFVTEGERLFTAQLLRTHTGWPKVV